MKMLLILFAIALIPISCAIAYLRIKNKALLISAGIGALAWLIALMRSVILQPTYFLIGSPKLPPIWFIGVSAILAGIFEKCFRYLFMKHMVSKRDWYNGVIFGLGAAFLEAILIYCIPVFLMRLQMGEGLPFLFEALPGPVERNLAACIHVGCSLLVLHSLRTRWMLGIAISFHSIVDFVTPTMVSHSSLTVWQVESVLAIFAGVALVITYLEKTPLSKPIEVEREKVSWGADFFGIGLRYHKFVCQHCGNIVKISSLSRLLGPHKPRSHYLKCPKCGKRSWMKVDRETYPEVK
ncbi:MAG: YhfC family glutamic-type intramembrane protease [Candidatus Cloacimonadia bacterium]